MKHSVKCTRSPSHFAETLAYRLQVKTTSKTSYSRMSYKAKEWMEAFEHWRRRA